MSIRGKCSRCSDEADVVMVGGARFCADCLARELAAAQAACAEMRESIAVLGETDTPRAWSHFAAGSPQEALQAILDELADQVTEIDRLHLNITELHKRSERNKWRYEQAYTESAQLQKQLAAAQAIVDKLPKTKAALARVAAMKEATPTQ